jgi:hypothetical protein
MVVTKRLSVMASILWRHFTGLEIIALSYFTIQAVPLHAMVALWGEEV